mmetsp:Transcript_11919/g.28875  ORF Transcript_11919/g.28875 Transcript_11919/m.28875 type:complete len:924 (+) Transcript_11919:340-3111(+)
MDPSLDSLFLIQDGHTRKEVAAARHNLAAKYNMQEDSLAQLRAGKKKKPRTPQQYPTLDRSKGLYIRPGPAAAGGGKEEFAEIDASEGVHHWTQDARGGDVYNLENAMEQGTGESFSPERFGKYFYRARQYPLYPQGLGANDSHAKTPAMAMEDFLNRTLQLSSGPRGRGNYRPSKKSYAENSLGAASGKLFPPLLYVQSKHQHSKNNSSSRIAHGGTRSRSMPSHPEAMQLDAGAAAGGSEQHVAEVGTTSVLVDRSMPVPDLVFLAEHGHATGKSVRGGGGNAASRFPEQDAAINARSSSLDDPSPRHRRKIEELDAEQRPTELRVGAGVGAAGGPQVDQGAAPAAAAAKSSAATKKKAKVGNRRSKTTGGAKGAGDDEESGEAEPDGVIGRNYNLMTLEDVARVPIRNDSSQRIVWRLTIKGGREVPQYFNVMPHREGVLEPGEKFEMRVKQNPKVEVPTGVYVFKLAIGDVEEIWLTQMFACVVPGRDDIRKVKLRNGQSYELLSKYGPGRQRVQWRKQAHDYYLTWHEVTGKQKVVLPPIEDEQVLAAMRGQTGASSKPDQSLNQYVPPSAGASSVKKKKKSAVPPPAAGTNTSNNNSSHTTGGADNNKPATAATTVSIGGHSTMPYSAVDSGNNGGNLKPPSTTASTRIVFEGGADTYDLFGDDDEEEKVKLPSLLKKEIELVKKPFPLAGLAEAEAAREAAECGVVLPGIGDAGAVGGGVAPVGSLALGSPGGAQHASGASPAKRGNEQAGTTGSKSNSFHTSSFNKTGSTMQSSTLNGSDADRQSRHHDLKERQKLKERLEKRLPPPIDYTVLEGEQLLHARRSYSFARHFEKPKKPKPRRAELEREVVKIANRPPPKKRAMNKPKTPPKTEFDKMGGLLESYAENYAKTWGESRRSRSMMRLDVGRVSGMPIRE